MNANVEFLARMVSLGVGATLTMDVWAFGLRKLGIPSLDFGLLGRWMGHLSEGRWFHPGIAKAEPVRGERLIGWAAHYTIGVSFAGLLLGVFGLAWARSPSLLPALSIGVVTVVAPLLVLQPALGAGIASTKTPRPVFNSLKSLVTHVVFGFGLYLSAIATAAFLRVYGAN